MFRLRLLRQLGVASILLPVAFSAVSDQALTLTAPRSNTEAREEIGGEYKNPLLDLLSQVKQSAADARRNRSGVEQQRRIALVIGNSAYKFIGKLRNPVNDATDMAAALRSLGFEVTLLKDVDLRQMEDAIDAFNRKLRQGGVGLFYFAGHGVQVEGENYLIPLLKARISREQDVRYDALPVGKVLGAMEDAGNEINVVILDACRDNPFARQWRSSRRGLAPVQSAKGTLIAYATEPGGVSNDGEGENGTYTSHLLRHIKTPDLDVEIMFKRVRAAVLQETNDQQTPWESSSLVGSFSFNPTTSASAPTSPPRPISTVEPNPTPSPVSPPVPSPTVTSTAKPTPSPSPETTTSPASKPTLISKATGVNYTKLRDLLEAGKWREADRETRRAMLQAAGREKERWFRTEDIDEFSCEDLRIIDQLWVESSQGKFGFSVQKDIYQNLGGTREYNREVWERFGTQVGWRQGNDWLNPDRDLTFNLTAPFGQLPTFMGGMDRRRRMVGWYGHILFSHNCL